MIRKLFSWVIVVLVLAGCADEAEPDPMQMGYEYYPLAVGDYREYYVTDIRFQFDRGDTTRFYLREIVKSTFTDQTNTLNYRIERFTRPDLSSPWVADSVFLVTKSLTNVIHTKDNTKRVKMVFPVKEGKTWIGDAYNDFGEPDDKEPYTFASVHEPFQMDNIKFIPGNSEVSFDSTVTVIQGTPVDDQIVRFDNRKEVYASHVGLVYRLFNRIMYCNNEAICPVGVSYKLDGHERHEVLINHGKL